MELIKKRVHMSKCNCKTTAQITLNDDFNVPDAKADALSLVKEQGEILHCDITANGTKGVLRGELAFTVLYLGDEEGRPVCDYSGTLPFEETVNLGERENDDEVTVHCRIDDLRGELINSRKIGMKAVVTAEIVAECIYDGEGAVGVEGEDVYIKERNLDVVQLAMCKKDTFRYRDQWVLPATKEPVEHILYCQVCIREMNTRLVEDKINITGQGKLFVLYRTAEEQPRLDFFETTFPIQGSVDCNGCDETMIPHIEMEIHSKDVGIKEDEDGEMRLVDLEMVINLFIKIFRQEQLQLLEDFYSTQMTIKPVYETSHFENLIMKNDAKSRIVGKIQLPEDEKVLQVWDVDGDLRVDSSEIVDNGVMVRGVADVSALYVTAQSDQTIGNAKASIPFEQLVEIPGIQQDSMYFLGASLDELNGAVLSDQEIEVKGIISLDIIAFEKISLPILSDFTWEELDGAKRSKEPGLVAYIVKESESLWDIAKEFYTTKEAIMELNELENERVHQGDMLLLMKEVPTI